MKKRDKRRETTVEYNPFAWDTAEYEMAFHPCDWLYFLCIGYKRYKRY